MSTSHQPSATNHRLWRLIATWFGAGLSPVASGTVGSLAALPFAYVIHVTFGNVGLFAAAFLLSALGVVAADRYMASSGSEHDPGEIVVDEVAGQWLLLSALYPSVESYFVGFFLFRFFDVFKPWPVSLIDRNVKGGIGVMLDDLAAAVYPIGVYVLFVLLLPLFGRNDLLLMLTQFLSGLYVW